MATHSPRPAGWDVVHLEKHFRRFLGRSPDEVRRDFCLERHGANCYRAPRVRL
jgi:hypothetical protein